MDTITKKEDKDDFLADLSKVREEHAQSVSQTYPNRSISNTDVFVNSRFMGDVESSLPDEDIDSFSVGDYNELYINDRQEYAMVMSAIRSKDGEDFAPGRIRKVFAHDSSYLYYYDRNGKPIIVERHNSISTPKLEEYNNVNKTRGNIGSRLETSRGGYGLNKNGNVFYKNREITSTNGRLYSQTVSEQGRSDRAGYTESGNNSNRETQAELNDSAFSMPENVEFNIPDYTEYDKPITLKDVSELRSIVAESLSAERHKKNSRIT